MGNKLETDFELAGIARGRDLAVADPDRWVVQAPKVSAKSNPGKCLADSLNYAARQMIKLNGPGNTSFEKSGYVARMIPSYSDESLLDQIVDLAYETSGAGGQKTQIAQVFSRFDRFSRAMVPRNAVYSGYTFFSRPRLNLQDWNICADRKFAAMMTPDATSIPFAIKCYLDTEFAKTNDLAGNSPLFDKGNPFLVPLSNALKSMSGFNDPTLVTETTEGGFFSEDQTYVIGGDRLARTYDINTLFRDYPGSPILAMIDGWCQYMANLQDGSMQQYADAIDANRMDYTVSIYRFLMDRTNRFIARWSKCTGCFPVSPPSGIAFNLNEGEVLVNAAAELNVPWKVNRIEYDDPIILKEFNMLVRRYAKIGDSPFTGGGPKAFAPLPQNNFSGIPYIRPTNNGFELVWLKRDKVGEYLLSDDGRKLSGVYSSDDPTQNWL